MTDKEIVATIAVILLYVVVFVLVYRSRWDL